MEGSNGASAPRHLPALRADIVLLHPPATYDFRGRRDIYFPFLGTTGDIPITPLYEYYPLGFRALQRHLSERGRKVEIVNLSTLFLRYRELSLATLAEALDARLIGIDLFWMVHAQGSLAVAEELKRLRPDLPVVLGGVTSSYYSAELIRYPFVDLVLRGYDTLRPVEQLLAVLEQGGNLATVPGLTWKDRFGSVRENPLPPPRGQVACGIDWSRMPAQGGASVLSVRELVTNNSAGCSFGCGWCGGSRDAFRRIYGEECIVQRKAMPEIAWELASMRPLEGADRYHMYVMGYYNEPDERRPFILDRVQEANVKSINYEQFHLTAEDELRRMVRANRHTAITLSPESHDLRVAKAAGRGVYTNAELEGWIEQALGIGIERIDIWYFVGMPQQDQDSVRGSVEYVERLLDRFGNGVNPMICPMVPVLDPASTFFEDPEPHGYRVFHRSLEEHRRAAMRPSLIDRMNYETRWLSREDIVRVGFGAVASVMAAKARRGKVPGPRAELFNRRLQDAVELTLEVHRADSLPCPGDRRRALEGLGDEILARNELVLSGTVIDQNFPVARPIGGRWCDDLGWAPEALDQLGLAAAAHHGNTIPARATTQSR
jgi:clorobiocin/coumermycin A biosynthesis protein CloN6/CouN6